MAAVETESAVKDTLPHESSLMDQSPVRAGLPQNGHVRKMEGNGTSGTRISSPDSRVSERERLELEALYPAALRDPSDLPSPESELEREPRFFLYYQNERVEAFLAPFPNVIDFSLPNTRISSAEFVGLRRLPPQNVPYQATSSASAQLPPPRRSVRQVLSGLRWKSANKPLGNGTGPKQVLTSANGTHAAASLPSKPAASLEGEAQPGEIPTLQKSWLPQFDSASAGEDRALKGAGESGMAARRRETWSGVLKTAGELGLQMFELLWKDGRSGNAIRRLKLETNEAGYDLVNSKLDRWAAEAHSSSILNDAAEAALTACGGQIKENPMAKPRETADGSLSLRRSLSLQKGPTTPRDSPGSNGRSLSDRDRRAEGEGRGGAGWPERPGGSGQGSPSSGEAMGTLPADRARMEAAKAAVELVGGTAQPAEALPDHVITWGSVMVEGKYLPKREGQSAILKDTHFKALAAALPARLRTSGWILLYSMARDGISLNTLYRKVAKKGATILVARDTRQHVFGCFGSEEWRTAPRYYGNGECFVFQVQPELKAYRWTRANSYFMYSTSSQLAMGGGTHYSLLINSDLLSGYSGECETFGSKPLAGSEEFELRQIEVWGFK